VRGLMLAARNWATLALSGAGWRGLLRSAGFDALDFI